ncbi:hydroxymethylpyrimidine/phosphomethylpyrimidine kinase [Variovorax paradoxus]|nr:hydroxymethylpyrimidine/phosphomethylpyrimidine kinase [Variovorax paradoxus]
MGEARAPLGHAACPHPNPPPEGEGERPGQSPIIFSMTHAPSTAPQAPLRYARVLSIAGSDSGGGAGIQADLKTFAALGCYGMTAITALTAQNTLGVSGIHGVPPAFLKAQIQAVVEDIGVDAVKLGMLHAPEIVEVVAWAIDHYRLPNVVLDPVMVATSGDRLIASETVQVLVRELFPRAVVVTPNLDEAALLIGHAIEGVDALDAAAGELLALGAQAVLLKGGHLPGDDVVDVLLQSDGARKRLASRRIASRNLHGTGCTLSSAIAAHLALGFGLPEAVERARAYVVGAMAAGADVKVGAGHGPLNHGFAPVPAHRLPL